MKLCHRSAKHIGGFRAIHWSHELRLSFSYAASTFGMGLAHWILLSGLSFSKGRFGFSGSTLSFQKPLMKVYASSHIGILIMIYGTLFS